MFFLKIICLFFLFGLSSFVCQARVNREDIVSFTLDYYQFKGKENDLEPRPERASAQEVKREDKSLEPEARQEEVKSSFGDFFRNYIRPNLKLTASLEQQYDDNIFRTNTNRHSEWTTNLNLDTEFLYNLMDFLAWEEEIGTGHTNIVLGFRGPYLEMPLGQSLGLTSRDRTTRRERKSLYKPRFSAFSALNYKRQKYGFDLFYELERDYANAVYIVTQDDFEKHERERVHFWVHKTEARIFADWNRVPTQLIYRRDENRYPTEFEGSNTVSDKISLLSHFNLTDFTKLVFQYDYEDNRYPHRIGYDWTANTFWLGVDGTFLRRLQLAVKYGQTEVDFKDNGSKSKGALDIAFNYIPKPGARLVPSLGVRQRTVMTPYEDEILAEEFEVDFDLRILPHFFKKIIFQVGGSYSEHDFGTGRKDNFTDYYFLTQYLMNTWTDIYFRYKYSERDSDIDVYNYKNNVFTTGVRLSF